MDQREGEHKFVGNFPAILRDRLHQGYHVVALVMARERDGVITIDVNANSDSMLYQCSLVDAIWDLVAAIAKKVLNGRELKKGGDDGEAQKQWVQ